MALKNHYSTLGVERTASPDEIKQAYRKMARKYHPDVSKEPDAEARFKEVAHAYEVLSDPEQRAHYDDMGQQESRRPPFSQPFSSPFGRQARGDGMDDADFFESLFGGRSRNRRVAGSDQHTRINIDLEDAFHGARRTVTLRLPGVDALGTQTLQERQLEVQIPKGVRTGQRLRLAGQGSPGQGGAPAGDLYLEIALKPHPKFRVEDQDLYTDLLIAPWEAALGATVAVATPEGEVHLSVPPGSSAGRKMRLKGRGLPGQRPQEPAGNLYAVLTIALPPADTPEAKEAYSTLAQAFPRFNPRS